MKFNNLSFNSIPVAEKESYWVLFHNYLPANSVNKSTNCKL